ncbi:MAG: hypothetical protein WBP56_08150, partial [Polyangia bacterium]
MAARRYGTSSAAMGMPSSWPPLVVSGDDGEEARRFTRARRGCGGMRTDPGAATGGGRPGSASAWGM